MSQRKIWWLAVGAGCLTAIAASLYWTFAPAYAGTSLEVSASVAVPETGSPEPVSYTARRYATSRSTLADVNGPRVYFILLIPVIFAVLPLLTPARRMRSAVSMLSALLLVAFVLVTGFSIGLLYTPSAGFAVVAAVAGVTWGSQ